MLMTILEAIGAALKAIFATPQRIFIAAVLVILAVAGGAVLTYRHERDAARAELAQTKGDLGKFKDAYTALAGSLQAQNAAVSDLEAQAKLRRAPCPPPPPTPLGSLGLKPPYKPNWLQAVRCLWTSPLLGA